MFRAKHNQLEHKLITVVKSYQDVPRELEDMLARCLDMRTLRYFEEY